MTEPSSEIPPNKPFALGKRSKSALKFMAVDPSIPVPIGPMATATSPPSPAQKYERVAAVAVRLWTKSVVW